MDPWDFFKYAAPLAVIAGGAGAVVQQAFKWTWRLAQVERDAATNADEIARVEVEGRERHEKLTEILACLPRIEIIVQQLDQERRSGNDRRVGAP